METTMIKANGTMVNNKGGNKMLKVNEAVRSHCLYCNKVLNKKTGKFCDRKCYNASRKVGCKPNTKEPATTKTSVSSGIKSEAPVTVEVSVNSGVRNNAIAFEKALLNMRKFESALTLHRLRKLIDIAGERALVMRVDNGIVINWVVGDKCYIIFYRPGGVITCRRCGFQEMKASIEKFMKRTMFKDSMKITEYVKLAEQMKGGE